MIYLIPTITPIARSLRSDGKKLVLVTGFFDLLHEEHINFLQKAKQAGDVLIVAVESDERARELKGEGRPIVPQQLRLKNLEPYADYLVALDKNFNNPTAYESLIRAIKPDILAVSSHTAHQDKKSAMIEKYGGQLQIVHTHNPSISTTNIIRQTKYN